MDERYKIQEQDIVAEFNGGIRCPYQYILTAIHMR